ncbi:MAG: hypothetical protein ABIQ30_18390 [Devosia sp.]
MKTTSKIILAGVFALALSMPAQAQGLLGGVLGGGGNSGDGGGGIVNGLLGSGGTVDTLLSGGGVSVPLDLGTGQVGVTGLATIETSSNSNGGSSIGITVLDGGGGTLSTNPLGLLGNGGGADVNLPDLGSLTGGGGRNGGNGGNGGTGGSGGNGNNGSNGNGGNGGNGGGINGTGGPNIVYYASTNSSTRNGSSTVLPGSASSRLQALLRILQQRDYLRLSNGRAVCLNGFGTAEVSSWIPQKEWGALQGALANYSQDIYALRQLLSNCRSGGQRQALNISNLNRVIGLDIGKDGVPVLYML